MSMRATNLKSSGLSPRVFPGRLSRQHGFSLLELMVALSVALILAGVMIINVQNAVRSIRLGESASSYANLLQQARMRAVRDDRFYSVLTVVPVGAPPYAFVDLQGTAILAPGDPIIAFQPGVLPQPFASGPSLANLKAQFLPPGPNAQNTVNAALAGPTFGPRGLPCTPVGGTCPYLTPPNFTPTSFITFLQNTQSTKWQAITVTPAGRIRQWSYDGNGNWAPLN
jgi:prepilin-type N-terminal cleavage/methylation domain-containing protein